MAGKGSPPGVKQGGRAKGTPNKVTAAASDMLDEAMSRAGGVEYLVKQAHANPRAFLAVWGRRVPSQVTGADNAPLFPGVSTDELRKRAIERLVAMGMSKSDAERAFLDG